MKKNWTGERLETFIYSRDAIEHLHRYSIMNYYIDGKVVLDIACGEGYGSNIMSSKAKFVYGVDIDEITVNAAKSKYKQQNLEYSIGDVTNISFNDDTFDVVVSFETIEHHDKHDEMMKEINRVLKPNGIFIISTPDKLFYSDKTNFKNKFHVKELYKNEFVKLVSNFFSNSQLLTQQYTSGVSVIQEEIFSSELTFFSGDYDSIHVKNINPMYLIIIASNTDFAFQKTSIFDGGELIEKQLKEYIYTSNSYRLGALLLSPLKFIKKIIK